LLQGDYFYMEHPHDTMETPPVTFMTLPLAEGSIEAGPDQQERLEEFTQRVGSGEFHVRTDGKIPFGCIDGRDTRDGLNPKPDSAGGTESLFVADDLMTQRYAAEDGSTVGGYAKILERVSSLGYEVGGHTDDHAAGEGSGCGANDRLPLIYGFIAQYGGQLREIATSLGVTVEDEAFNAIVANAKDRAQFSTGRELLDALKAYGQDKVDPLEGSHKEVVAVINTKEGTTLDRLAVRKEFGPDYQAFNVDVWTFNEAAEVISETPEEVEAATFAMTLYNLATAHVLCGKNMRVIVL
jgi:hypothetical protein